MFYLRVIRRLNYLSDYFVYPKLVKFNFKVHRRLLNDDALGVGEALDEHEFDQPVVARGQFILTFGKIEDSAAIQKSLVHRKLVAPTVFIGQTDIDLHNLQESINFEVRSFVSDVHKSLF